jgi:hypothetical protein
MRRESRQPTQDSSAAGRPSACVVARVFFLWLLLVVVSPAWAETRVAVFVGDAGGPLERALAALREVLVADSGRFTLDVVALGDAEARATPPAADMHVALGTRASAWLAQHGGQTPRLYGLIPLAVWQALDTCCPAPSVPQGALLIDRPLIEQLRLVRALLPAARRVAVLLGPTSVVRRPELERAAARLGLEPVIGEVGADDRPGPVLRAILGDADALVALADPVVFNRGSLYPILLTTYSARVPVIGYSRAMVEAGAAAAVVSSPEAAGRDLGRAILAWLDGAPLDVARPTPSLSVALNPDVLRSLRLQTPDAADLRQQVGEGLP